MVKYIKDKNDYLLLKSICEYLNYFLTTEELILLKNELNTNISYLTPEKIENAIFAIFKVDYF